MIEIALVGAGYIGRIHAQIIGSLGDTARVVAVTDRIGKKGKALSDEIGAAFYPNLETLLANVEVDAVAVASPTESHEAYVTLAARRGKHVFCEKPLAQSLDEADRMIEAVRNNGVGAMAGHVLRFWPVYVRTREIIASGEIGNPMHGYCERLLALPDWQEGGWHLRQKDGRAAAFDVQIHDLDYLTWLFGRPLKVQSGGLYDADRGGWMHMNTRVDYEGGRTGYVQAGWGFPKGYPFTMTIRILCEGGTVEWNFKAGQLLETRDREAPLVVYKNDGSFSEERVDRGDPFLLEWRYFFDCISEGRKIERATFEEGRTALKLALASIESACKGSRVIRLEGS
jgi:UDP-N-acetylglucosamine 3-dehydrogenase